MKLTVLLKNLKRFHAGGEKGTARQSDITVRSTTIASALGVMYVKLFGKDPREFLSSFVVSSMFFLYESNEKKEYLVPAPKKLRLSDEISDVKRYKKASFVKLSNLKEWMYGDPEKAYFEKSPLIEVEVPSVSIDRLDLSSNLYHESVVEVRSRFIPYIFAEVEDGHLEEFKACFRLLGDMGLGGDRTRGLGLFEPEFVDYFPEDGDGNDWIILSLYRPSGDELRRIADGDSRYKIVRRGGWVFGTDSFKPRLAFMEEGSVFSFKPIGEDFIRSDYMIQGRTLSIRV